MKRYFWLILTILCSLLLIYFIQIDIDSKYKILLGLGFILFFPGYGVFKMIFPKTKNLDDVDKLGISFALSLIITLIYYFLFPERDSLLYALALTTLITTGIGLIRSLTTKKVVDFKELNEKLEFIYKRTEKYLTILLLVLLIACILGTVYIILNPKQTEYFTEFYILGENGKAYDYPTKLLVNETGKVIIGIVNHEGKTINYYIEIYLVNASYKNNKTIIYNATLLDRFNVTLPPKPINIEGNWTPEWEMTYNFSIDKPGNWQLWFILYKNRVPNENATKKILDAINNKYLSLKLNIEVR